MIPYRLQVAGRTIAKRARTLRGIAHLDLHDPAGTVLLAGSGRGGTTWLSQIINHNNTYRDIFEPFSPGKTPAVSHYPEQLYLRPDEAGEDYRDAAAALLAGRVRGTWTDGHNRKLIARRRLIKDIRLNLMLGWLGTQFPQVKTLLALRHPCAVAHSRLKLGWEPPLSALLNQPTLINDYLLPHLPMIQAIASSERRFEQHVLMWCIENLVPLRQLKPGDAHVMMYEQVCTDFETEVQRLFAFLGRPVPRGIDRSAKKVSAHFRRDSAILQGGDLIGDWRRHISGAQVEQAFVIIRQFGLGHLYDAGADPLIAPSQVLGSLDAQSTRGATNLRGAA